MPVKMEIKASRTLKWLYCLTLAGFIVTGVALSFSRIGYTSGGLFRYGLTVAILVFILSSMRMVHVIRHPQTLDVFATSRPSKWMRSIGVFLMWVGLAGVVGFLFPALLKYLAGLVHVYLIQYSHHHVTRDFLIYYAPAYVGILGLLLFEGSRLWGNRSLQKTLGAKSLLKLATDTPTKLVATSMSALVVVLVILSGSPSFCFEKGRYLTDDEFILIGLQYEKQQMNVDGSEASIRDYYAKHPDCCRVFRGGDNSMHVNRYNVIVQVKYELNQESANRMGIGCNEQNLVISPCGKALRLFGQPINCF